MDWECWKQWYFKIVSDFKYDPNNDLKSASLLNTLLQNKAEKFNFKALNELIQDEIVFVYGCGPSLPYHLKLLKNSKLFFRNFIHFAADGATSALLECNLVPQVIITDLDGSLPDIIDANRRGAIVIIHAHGDNIAVISKTFSSFSKKVLGTTQNKPLTFVKNYGGFTDGDRCVYLAEAMGASCVVLFGFDLGSVVGKYSKPYLKQNTIANKVKMKKLKWAQRLISELSIKSNMKIIKVDGKGKSFGNVKTYSFEDLQKFLLKK